MLFEHRIRTAFGANDTPLFDHVAAVKALDPEGRGRKDARLDEPASGASRTHGALEEIRAYHVRQQHERNRQYGAAFEKEAAIQAEARLVLEQPSFEVRVGQFKAELAKAAAAFTAAAEGAQQRLTRITQDLRAFKDAAGLGREPLDPRSPWMHWALVVAFVLGEAVGNMVWFSANGLLSGVLMALCVAAVNCFLGFAVGNLFRLVNDVSARARAIGWAITAAYAVFLPVLHLGVAHYRNAMFGLWEGVRPDHAGQAALAALIQHPFSLLTVESWALFIIGMAFALIAAVAGYRTKDPVPQYSELAARRRQALEELQELKDDYLAGVNEIFSEDNVHEAIDEPHLAALQALATHRVSVARVSALTQDYRALVAEINSSNVSCATRYLEAYKRVRGDGSISPPPVPQPIAEADCIDVDRYRSSPLDELAVSAQLKRKAEAARAEVRDLYAKSLSDSSSLFADIEKVPGRPSEAPSRAPALECPRGPDEPPTATAPIVVAVPPSRPPVRRTTGRNWVAHA